MAGVLLAHSNFPAQFAFIAQALVRQNVPVAAVSGGKGMVPGVLAAQWTLEPGQGQGAHPMAARSLDHFLGGRAAAVAAVQLKERGFDPDVIVGHPGMGSTLFLKEVFPRARLIVHAEYYHTPHGGDGDFDPEFWRPAFEDYMRIQSYNAPLALAYAEADELVAPTQFQKDRLPPAFRARARVIHEGVDTDLAKPDPEARFTLADGRILDRSTPVITYVSRRFEPLRGVHIFLRALPRLLQAVPEAQVVVIGSDDPNGYGLKMREGGTWRGLFMDQLKGQIDASRVHFMGPAAHQAMLGAMAISWAHVYYTYPFVLSWSMLEAMACECLVIGSDTAPVAEVIEHGRNGLLLDFFDVEALSEAMIQACRQPERFAPLRAAARATIVDRFDRKRLCLPAWMDLIEEAARSA